MPQSTDTIRIEIPTGGTVYELTAKEQTLPKPLPPYEGGYTATQNGTLPTNGKSMYHDVTVAIPEYSGPYAATQNGTLQTNGKVMSNDVTVAIPEYEGNYTVTENGVLPTTGKVMTNDLTVSTPVAPDYEGPYSVTQNGELQTSGKKMTQNVTVNVASNGILEAAWAAYKLNHSDDWSRAFQCDSRGYAVFSKIQNFDALDFSGSENVRYMEGMFEDCASLVNAPAFNTSRLAHAKYMFYNCTSLVSVPAYNVTNVSGTNEFLSMFTSCSNLETIHMYGMKVNFSISASTKFTREALLEIINNCADLTGGTAMTLTIGSTNLAKLTADDIAIATAKNWTLA